ncbi:hypothetical protein [Ramlibacter sp.]|uniref:hypothetical protein n=1 Tax=Ramlibacter sp. TaxID=1917967 RepID=UPI002CFC83D4|nr:hypothetical protein [Ramlibacter sp.]HWI81994.1 hypothetical protein [Ramlibacter sp.]
MKHDPRSGSVAGSGAGGGSSAGAGDKYGPPLRVPPEVLQGERKEEKPCITPIDCVMANRCAGHCGCR